MSIADLAFFINHKNCGHAPELQQVHFLVIAVSHLGFYIRAADERQLLFLPIFSESVGAIGSQGNDFDFPFLKLTVVLAQLRQMFAAVGSHKAAHQYQNDVFAAEL